MTERIVYMGTPELAATALEAILGAGFNVVGVVTNPDRPAGRGKKIVKPHVKVVAENHGVPVFQPKGVRSEAARETIASFEPDLIVVAAYGRILPPSLLELPRLGCVNIHASLLPKYRGAAPINWCIVRGEAESGVSIMKMDEGMDTGPVMLMRALPIGPSETAGDLHDRLAELGAQTIVEALPTILAAEAEFTAQDHEAATYAPMMTKADGSIDWSRTAVDVANHIRGFNPWPGAASNWLTREGAPRVKFHLAAAASGDGNPGEVLATRGEILIACGTGAVRVLELQAPGKKRVGPQDFVNGARLACGDRFGAPDA